MSVAAAVYAPPRSPWERGEHVVVFGEAQTLTGPALSAVFAIHRQLAAKRAPLVLQDAPEFAPIFDGLSGIAPALHGKCRVLRAVPLIHRTGRIVGEIVLICEAAEERWDSIETLRHLAALAAVTLENAERLASAKRDQERLLLVAETTEEALWDWNLDTEEFWWGGGLQTLLRAGTEPIQPKPAWRLARMHPGDVDRVQHSFEKCVASVQSSWNEQYRFRRTDGAWAFLEDHAYFLREANGRAYRAIGAVRDVTALHESNEALRKNEERLRAALDASQIGTYVWHIATGEILEDEGAKRLYGFGDGQGGTLDARAARVFQDDRGAWRRALGNTAQHGVEFHQEYRVVRPDGSVHWMLDKGRLVRAADGTSYMPGAVIDITGRKALEVRHEQAHRRALDANRSKDEFLAMLGHELRNPLSPMLTALQLLRLRGMASREIDVLERQVGHLTRLVDDLLDISRITRGKIELRKTEVELADVVAQAIEIASPLLEQRRHTMLVNVPRGVVVLADAARMAQVVSNLLTNAAKYSDPSSTIEVVGERHGERLARVRVVDQGVGIDAQMLASVFDMFVQHPQTIDRSHGGLGLGLAIVKNLVEMHGGSVRASSAGRGKGSEFIIELPTCAASTVDVLPADAPTVSAVPAVGSKRILVVDDNPDGAEMLKMVLNQVGLNVEIAHDGPSGLALAKQFRPHIALLDIGLPVMDGYELATRLREQNPLGGIRLVAITGYGQEEDKRRTTAAGFDLHLVKPIDVPRLIRAIQALETGDDAALPRDT